MKSSVNKHEFRMLLLWPVFASVASFVLKADFYVSIFLFLIAPAIYLSYKHPRLIRKSAIFSVLMAVPFAFLFDYVMQLTGAWVLGRMFLPEIKILEYISLGQVLWGFCFAYLVVVYYEIFFDKVSAKVFYPRTKWLVGILAFVLGSVIIGHFFHPDLLYINYFYLKAGFFMFLVPLIALLVSASHLRMKFLKVGLFFAYYMFLYEITALELGQWSFPATHQFIGFANIFNLSLPIEELIVFIVLGAVGGLAYYEFFDDDTN